MKHQAAKTFLGPTLMMLYLLTLDYFAPAHDPILNVISSLSLAPAPIPILVSLTIYLPIALLIIYVAGFHKDINKRTRGFLYLAAIGVFTVIIFPCKDSCSLKDLPTIIHDIGGYVSFIAAAIAMIFYYLQTKENTYMREITKFTLFATLLPGLMALAFPQSPYYGLLERVTMYALLIWLSAATWNVLDKH